MRERAELMDKEHPKISMRRQSELLGVARSTAAYNPVAEDPEEIRIKRKRSTEHLLQFCQRSGGSGSYAMRLSMA